MLTNAIDHNLEHPGEWAISVASLPGATADDIAGQSPYPGRWMRVSTVGEVRALGHDVVRSGKPPHADLILASEPTEEVWEDLRGVFEEPEVTPRWRRED